MFAGSEHLYTSNPIRELHMNTSWKITKIEDGEAVASVEGVSQVNAVQAIRRAMDGEDPFGHFEHAVAGERSREQAVAA
jgi:hypothetical protein